jgi:Protein of unknown function (DUF1761)
MYNALTHLNYLAVLGTTVAGSLLGWLWYSPLLCGKAWRVEMKITDEKMKECAEQGLAKYMIQGFVYTLLSTVGLAVLIRSHGTTDCVKGAEFGIFVGLIVVGTRLLNSGVWEQRSLKLSAITVGHEVALFAVQGAILAVWR